jgi:hypothetical protein
LEAWNQVPPGLDREEQDVSQAKIFQPVKSAPGKMTRLALEK